ncbi:LLM class flavin-dependent oxidoreductase [Lampropedia puyangensis]|uniref:Luciferase-like monooxygenase n=1 Tax=Lampropedia puyangensis TaxID=1330072 RepID=A0A4S8FBK0_9BURK|nr:LLM class flavin-dependent oxidoreductase [Lampropedia puyangensis]THU05058.1 LLM class flavin-dependent oxidoreductase [Lampropedia puyangensis]
MPQPTVKPQLSMLDLVTVRQGQSVAGAIETAVRTAQHVEQLGFTRYWMAEHHNMPGIASSSTAVLIGHVAGQTQRIRVGAGGIMLPNHAPLVVAEAFGTLEAIYPGRIDLGLGRAPGTDQPTMRALRRGRMETEDDFPREVQQLQLLLGDAKPGQPLVATPGAGSHVPIWLLGSSLFSAQLAAHLGLPYAFASHFAPRFLQQAIHMYRDLFQPSKVLDKPHVMVGVPIVAAATDEEAEFLASSTYQRILGILTNQRGLMQPPVEGFMQSLDASSHRAILDFLAAGVIGGPDTLQQGIQRVIETTQADEFMVVTDLFDVDARLQSLTLTAQALAALNA